MNSYTKFKLVWYRNNAVNDPVVITSVSNVSSNETDEPVNNKCTIECMDNDLFYDEFDKFIPREGDTMIVYYKEVTNNDDVEFNDFDILFTGKFIDYSKSDSPDTSSIKLKIFDYGYDIFNKFEPSSYIGLGMKTNEIVVDVLRRATESETGDGTFKINTDNVATTRQDGTDFPVVEPAFGVKPVYEWMNELSNTEYTNTENEILNGDLVHKRDMIFRILGDSAYWFYPSTTEDLLIDENTYIDSISEQSNNEEEISVLYLQCGVDFNDRPIMAYIPNNFSSSNIVKERVEVKKALGGGNTDYDKQYHQIKKNYDESTNQEFREAVRKRAKGYAETWFKLFGSGDRSINVTLPFTRIYYGNLVRIDLPRYSNRLFKVESVRHSISKNGGTTTLKLKEYTESEI